MKKKKIAILGSTGSIGIQALQIIARFPEKFKVVGLSARKNLKQLKEQVKKFCPQMVWIPDEQEGRFLKDKISYPVKILSGRRGLCELSSSKEVDLVLLALAGSVGLEPLLSAIDAGKAIALANKEPMVMAGQIIMSRAQKKGVKIIPVDSEHSAIFQLLQGKNSSEVSQVIITSSGGPFRTKSLKELNKVTLKDALKHPTWKMGKKITVDSATLINKALELIEARWFFDLKPEQLKVLIHPQSIIHSLVEMKDRTVFAQLALPDMRIPIAYALFYPERPDLSFPRLNLEQIQELKFEPADPERFPALRLGFDALKKGGTLPVVMNAADEEAVSAFLLGQIGFNRIVRLVEQVMKEHKPKEPDSLEEVLAVDLWARQRTKELINA